jgi:hypothetical protein
MGALNGVGFAIGWVVLYVLLLVACEPLAGQRRSNR